MTSFGRWIACSAIACSLLGATPSIAQNNAKSELAAALSAMKAQEIPAAIRHFTDACNLGSAEACVTLGDAFAQGDADHKSQAPSLYERGCAAGVMVSCHNAAAAYYSGSVVAKDLAHAEALFEKGCGGGLMQSCVAAARSGKPALAWV